MVYMTPCMPFESIIGHMSEGILWGLSLESRASKASLVYPKVWIKEDIELCLLNNFNFVDDNFLHKASWPTLISWNKLNSKEQTQNWFQSQKICGSAFHWLNDFVKITIISIILGKVLRFYYSISNVYSILKIYCIISLKYW